MNIVFLNGKQCWLYLKLVGYEDRIVKQIYHLGLVATQALTCFRRLANKKFVIVLDYFVKLFNVDICYYLLRHVFYSTLWCHRIKVFFSLDILSHSNNKGEAWNSFKTYCTSRPRKHLTFLYVINVNEFEHHNQHLPRQHPQLECVEFLWFINSKKLNSTINKI